MKIFCCYTQSHQEMFFRHFKPSLPGGLELHALTLPQQSETGSFTSNGFQATCLAKVNHIIEIVKSGIGREPFIFSDVDVRFYGDPTANLLAILGNDRSILFQDDGAAGACTGFMVLRPTMEVHDFWVSVASLMKESHALDQDASNRMLAAKLAPAWALLPRRYWTVGAASGKVWEPGQPIRPPFDLMVHHANWTVGIENKLVMLQLVKDCHGSPLQDGKASDGYPVLTDLDVTAVSASNRIRRAVVNIDAQRPVSALITAGQIQQPPQAEHHPFGTTPAQLLLEEQNFQCQVAESEPDNLAIVLSYWRGDKDKALALARLLADIEPTGRDDVWMVFSRQKATPMDADIERTMDYCQKTFNVVAFEAKVDESKAYPGIAFDPWASAMEWCSDSYCTGLLPCPNSLFIEPDGVPLRGWRPDKGTWIDDIKRAHAETLLLGKRVTGPRHDFGGNRHVNASLVAHWSLWSDRPSLHRCPPTIAFDVFHGHVLLSELGQSQIIRNEYGCTDLTAAVFLSMAKEAAWLTSIKDRSAFGHAESLLTWRGGR